MTESLLEDQFWTSLVTRPSEADEPRCKLQRASRLTAGIVSAAAALLLLPPPPRSFVQRDACIIGMMM